MSIEERQQQSEQTFAERGQRLETLAEKQGLTGDGTITLSTGVVVRAKTLPPGVFTRLYQQWMKGRPAIPKMEVLDEDTGRKFTVPNPDDPDYLAALDAYQAEFNLRTLDLAYAFGLEIVSIPDGVQRIEDEDWRAYFELSDEPLPETPAGLRLAWLNIVAIGTTGDMERIQKAVMPNVAVSPEAVKEAEAGFRRTN